MNLFEVLDGRRHTLIIMLKEESSMNKRGSQSFGYCFNTSTIKGQGLDIVRELEIIAEAGYDGVEPWIKELDEYTARGGSLEDLRKRITDLGLSVENVIGFFEWIVDDDALRAKGLEEAKRNLDIARRIGARRLACPPMGATEPPEISLNKATERYRRLLEISRDFGVVAVVECWGFSYNLRTLGEAIKIAIDSGDRNACVLADVYHIYKSGGSFDTLRLLGPHTLGLLHFNDYPAEPPREEIGDKDRVYPGDGVAPVEQILRDLRDVGYSGMLSIELFNEEYWQDDPLKVARTALEKTRSLISNL